MKMVLYATMMAVLYASTAFADSSSFQRSCQDIQVNATNTNAFLVATCGDGKGGWKQSRIELYGIHNDDGQLVQPLNNMGGPSSFQRSCEKIRIRASNERAVLVADCRRRDQSMARAQIEIFDIENIFGTLKFR